MVPEQEGDKGDQERPPPTAGAHQVGEEGGKAEADDGQRVPQRFPRARDWLHRLFEPISLLTLALVVLTGFYVHYTRGLLDRAQQTADSAIAASTAAKEANRLTSASMTSNLSRAEESNRIARDSLVFSREALAVAESPWISTAMKRQPLEAGKDGKTLTVTLSNGGRSPAFNLKGALLTSLLTELPVDFPKIAKTGGDSASLLGPGRSQDMHTHLRPLAQEQIAAIESGALIAFLFGDYAYEDRFGGRHHLRFCYWMEWKEPGYWAYCPAHNTYDYKRPPRQP